MSAGDAGAAKSNRPAPEGFESWNAYWTAPGMPWRTEPEIDEERQRYLAERRAVTPDIEQGIYPFKDVRLTRADVEWLLATHHSGGMSGPIDWSDTKQRWRRGPDFRGLDARNLDLHGLPLARSNMKFAHFENAILVRSHMEQADLEGAYLEGTVLWETQLQSANLPVVHAKRVALTRANLAGADLTGADLKGGVLAAARLEGADLHSTQLQGANLRGAHLEGANLAGAHLEGTRLASAEWQHISTLVPGFPEVLCPADMRGARLDSETNLEGVTLGNIEHGFVRLAGARLESTDLYGVDWAQIPVLGDEQFARRNSSYASIEGTPSTRRAGYDEALRANRQLAVALRNQGLNEHADRFAYRAQVLQRHVLLRRAQVGKWLFSLLLAGLAGYGYRLRRILIAYLLTLAFFAAAYILSAALYGPHLTAPQALLVSLTAIHGRVFFEQFGLNSPLSWAAAIESVVGIVIEAVFVGMLVQRFFGGR